MTKSKKCFKREVGLVGLEKRTMCFSLSTVKCYNIYIYLYTFNNNNNNQSSIHVLTNDFVGHPVRGACREPKTRYNSNHNNYKRS